MLARLPAPFPCLRHDAAVAAGLVLLGVLGFVIARASPPVEKPLAASFLRAQENFGRLPLHFDAVPVPCDETAGSAAATCDSFVVRSHTAAMALTSRTMTLHLRGQQNSATPDLEKSKAVPSLKQLGFQNPFPGVPAARKTSATVRMRLLGSAAGVQPLGVERLPGRTNLLIGNDPSRWQRGIGQFGKVLYRQVYEGIDLVFYGNLRELEYDFRVAPGADPRNIRLSFDGARRLRVDATGDLILETGAGNVRQRRPRAYQIIDGAELLVASAFQLSASNSVRFRIGEYDARYPLVIDPVLVYSTYLGGNGSDLGLGIAVDAEGSAYITGQVASDDFPHTPQFPLDDQPDKNDSHAFVTKLDPTGTRIVYSTFIGGDDYDIGNDIAVDAAGSAYITGETKSGNFPTARPIQGKKDGDRDVFVAKLSVNGANLIYSTFLGGKNIDVGNGIAVDSSGAAYVAGVTFSKDFPTTSGAYREEFGGTQDVFAAKISADGGRLAYSTFIGGSGTDAANDVAVDSAGNAYIVGITDAIRSTGIADAYCLKLDPAGSKVVYAKLFGGASIEEATAVAIDAAGNAYVTGATYSKDFPVTPGAYQTKSKSPQATVGLLTGYDTFIAKIDPQGENLLYASYLNGSDSARGRGIAIDKGGNIVVAGFTKSIDFPSTPDAPPTPVNNNEFNTFLAKLNPAGNTLLYSARFGGVMVDEAMSLALDPTGNIYITGFTNSDDYPTTTASFLTQRAGSIDAFVMKFSAGNGPAVTAAGVVSGASFLAGGIAPGMLVSIFGTDLGPADLATLELDGSGLVKTELAGTRVLFNNVPAPLVFVSSTQVGAIAPYALADQATLQLVLERAGARSAPVALPVAPSAPGLFTVDSNGSGRGAILNQDGSINSSANAAAKGSIVSLFGTGEGQTDPAGQDGKIAAETLPRPRLDVSVQIGGREAEILYAGAAPSLVAGVLQVNARIPADLAQSGDVPVVLRVGGASSQPHVTVAVH